MKKKIIKAAIEAASQKGIKFTMDDLAKNLGMSKKTIYTMYETKDDILYDMVEYVFDDINARQDAIMADESLKVDEKLKQILCTIPESYRSLDFSAAAYVKDKYPKVYKLLKRRIETNWGNTYALLDEGMKRGIFTDVSILVFKTVYQASIERFLSTEQLKKSGISYPDALSQLAQIMVEGIKVHRA